MIIFWIFTLFVGATTFAFTYIFLQLGLALSLVDAFIAMLLCRGILTMVRRSLILRERISAETDTFTRTVETNRAIFWRRALFLAALPILYFAGADLLFGLAPADALAALPQAIVAGLTNLLYVLFLLGANFMLFLGPFYIYTRIGKTMILPDDANFGVNMEDVRGQKGRGDGDAPHPAPDRTRSPVRQSRRQARARSADGRASRHRQDDARESDRVIASRAHLHRGRRFFRRHVPGHRCAQRVPHGARGTQEGQDLGRLHRLHRRDRRPRPEAFRSGGGGGGAMGGMGGMFGGGQLGLNMLLVLMDGIDNPGMIVRQPRGLVNLTLDGLFLPRLIAFNGTRLNLRIPALKAPNYNILFIGATNRPSVLDEALTRPGRFGRQIVFRLPNREDRKDIAALYFDKKNHDPALDTPSRREEFARITDKYSPADIEQVLSLSLLYAFEDARDAFNWKDVREAMGNVEAGLAIPVEYTDRDKIAVARHELGHAVASHFFKTDHSHVRLSIRRRATAIGEIGGYHKDMPAEEEWMKFRSQMVAEIRHDLGSIACEHVFYGEGTNGVYMDLRMATAMASSMVGVVGMGPDKLDEQMSKRAANIGEQLISVAEVPSGTSGAGLFHRRGSQQSPQPAHRRADLGLRIHRRLASHVREQGGDRPGRRSPDRPGGADGR